MTQPGVRRSLLRATLLLLPFQVVFRGGEVLLPFLLAMWFGRSNATDVYFFAVVLFKFAGSLVFTAYQDSALVPILIDVRAHDRSALPRVTGSLLAHTLAFGGALALAIGAIALGWFRFRYSGPDLALAVRMVAPFCLYLVALSVKTLFSALLNAEHHFFAYPLASCIGMVATLVLIALGRDAWGVLSIPVSLLAGELVAIAVLVIVAFGLAKMRMSPNFTRPEPVRRFAKLVASEVFGGAVTRVNPWIDQLMAGLAGVIGGATLLGYSNDVAYVATSLLQAALLPVLLSHLADDFAVGNLEKIRATVTRSLWTVCTLLIGVTVLLFALRGPLLRLVFLHGKMDPLGVARMIGIFPYHLVGLAPFGALLILARAHVALKNSGIMLQMGILNAALNAGFNLVLLRYMGLEGIALSTSCVQLAVAVVFWFRLDAKLLRVSAAA